MVEISSLFQNTLMTLVISLVAIEVVVAVVGHVMKGDFNFHELANFLHDLVIGYIVGFAVVEYIGEVLPVFAFLVPVSFAFLVLTLLAGIWNALGKFGIDVPKIVSR